ncbi:MAG TPA: nitroreductase family protein [Spirochaetota bacterium]|nr:nitroreductase family protein [Spirochaetota bacterium]
MPRNFNYDILPQIKTRWSPRAYSEEKIPREDLLALIEAARYAPSCYNEQPWRFVIADTPESLEKFRSTLADMNVLWAKKAPVLIAVCSKKSFSQNGASNFWHQFDTGTAWGFLSLEAERRGLYSHGMAGFNRDAITKIIGLPADYEVMAMVAVGKPGNKNDLPTELLDREEPGTRKEIPAISFFETFAHK